MRRRALWSIAVATIGAAALSSCAALNIDALPQPGKTYSGGYNVVIEFDNVLNLPDRAKVIMDGTQVGVVTKMALSGQHVDVTARIDPRVVVPSNAHAGLQQATVLGDIYVTLDLLNSATAAPALPRGAIIPLTQTTSPPQLEATIAHLANFVLSGSIQRLQNTIVGINHVTPPVDKVRRLASQVAADLSDLSDNIEVVDQWLSGVAATGQILNDRVASAQYWFSPRGMTGLDYGTQIGSYFAKFFPTIGSVYTWGYWLQPLLKSVANEVAALQQSKWAFEDESPAWRRLFTDFFLPQDKYPAINITSIVGPDGRELSGDVTNVLRIIGAAP